MRRLAAALLLAAALAGCGRGSSGAPATSHPPPPQPTSTPQPPASSTLPPFGSTVTVSAAPETQRAAHLRGVRIGRHPGFERLVLEFRGGLPGYRVGYVEPPIVGGASGQPLHVAGRAFLELRLEPATGAPFGQARIEGRPAGARMVRELVRSEDFEAVLSWVAGLDARVPFRVFTLQAPTRLVVDLRTS